MINVTDIVQSSGWKNFMAKLYGWGASVVIIGALFKINHWPGGAFIITLGLTTEAIIFFFSAFEPLHEELDWTLVYPELAGMSDPDEIENFKESTLAAGDRSVENIENVLATTGVDNEAITKLGTHFNRLSETARGLADLSNATVATQSFLNNLDNAAASIGTLNDTYASSAQSIKDSASSLSNAYLQTADSINKSGEEITNTYRDIAETVKNEHSAIATGSKSHVNQIEKLNNSLNTLNEVYENQIKETTEQLKGSHEVYNGLKSMVQNLKESVDETNKYKEEISSLKNNISSLNTIYGNMLSTMNVLTKK
jgi:gliding motility-associated protein GldL